MFLSGTVQAQIAPRPKSISSRRKTRSSSRTFRDKLGRFSPRPLNVSTSFSGDYSLSIIDHISFLHRVVPAQAVQPHGLLSVVEAEFRNTRSTNSVQKALDWIVDCTRFHSLCGPNNSARLPTRVIDVFKCLPDIALVESQSDQFDGYVCLSHC